MRGRWVCVLGGGSWGGGGGRLGWETLTLGILKRVKITYNSLGSWRVQLRVFLIFFAMSILFRPHG